MSDDAPDDNLPLEPCNALEEQLAAAQNGELSSADFLEYLAHANVHILINQSLAEETAPTDVEPLVVLGPDDQAFLATFTFPDRASVMTQRFPEFAFTLEVDFPWVLANAGDGMGVVINPGWTYGASLPPEAVAHMRNDS